MLSVELNWLEDAEILGRIGRHTLAAIVRRLERGFGGKDMALPDASLPDALYFPKLAALFRARRMRLVVRVRRTGGSADSDTGSASLGAGRLRAPGSARYALQRDGPFWHLTFDGRAAILKHEKGLCYVAEALSKPGEPLKKLSLAAKYSTNRSGSIEVYDPATGFSEMPSSSEAIHQASLDKDALEARRRCRARARALKEVIGDPARTQAARAEARAELAEITAYLAKDRRARRDETKAAGDAVRNALKRLFRTLLARGGPAASPESVRRDFARHLQRYLVVPSERYGGPRARRARGELTGCLLYDPPPGIVWTVRQQEKRPGN